MDKLISVRGLKRFKQRILQLIPSTLPASGGNADTAHSILQTSKSGETIDLNTLHSTGGDKTYYYKIDGSATTIVNGIDGINMRGCITTVNFGDGNWGKQIYSPWNSNETYCRAFGLSNGEITFLDWKKSVDSELYLPSNPNLLDNPDLQINQRENIVEDTVYTKGGYFFDRWTSHADLNYKKTSECLEIYRGGDLGGGIFLTQHFETNLDANEYYTVSIYTTSGAQSITIKPNGERHTLDKCHFSLAQSGASMIIMTGVTLPFKGIKLELGDHATPFIPPHPSIELLKCQRYFWKIGSLPDNVYKPSIFIAKKMDDTHIRLTPTLNPPTNMRTFPSVKINDTNPAEQVSLRCTNDGSVITGKLYVDGFCVYRNGLSCIYLNDWTGTVNDGFLYEACVELSADL